MGWRNEVKGTPPSSTAENPKSCSEGEIIPCHSRGKTSFVRTGFILDQ